MRAMQLFGRSLCARKVYIVLKTARHGNIWWLDGRFVIVGAYGRGSRIACSKTLLSSCEQRSPAKAAQYFGTSGVVVATGESAGSPPLPALGDTLQMCSFYTKKGKNQKSNAECLAKGPFSGSGDTFGRTRFVVQIYL